MSEVSGLVEKLLVDDGDLVAEGQPLVLLRSAPTQFSLDQARAELAQQQAELDELVNGERPEDIRAREADLMDAKARLVLAEDEEKRTKDLLDSGSTSQSAYDVRRADLDRARAAVDLAQASLERAQAGARVEMIASKRAEVASYAARVAALEDQLDRHTLRAPFDGVVGQKSTEAGQWLDAGTTTFALAEIDVLRVEVNVPERHFNSIPLGAKGQVTIDALGDLTKDATVTIRIPLGNTSARTFPVRLDVPNPDYNIAPGMFARVSFLVSPGSGLNDALLVPKDALLVEGTGSTRRLWVVQEGKNGPEAFPKTVRTLGAFRDMVIIAEGEVEVNDSIVVRGNEGLMFPGQAVNPRPHVSQSAAPPAPDGLPSADLAGNGSVAGRR
jgi:RND family efflux transporter MFP subunit